MNEIKAAGSVPTLTILEPDIDDWNILKREKYWIQFYLAQGALLLNIQNLHPPVLEKRDPKCIVLNVKEVQERLGISESTLFRLLKSKKLKGFKVGRVWKFEESDIESFIQRQREEAEAEQKEEPAA